MSSHQQVSSEGRFKQRLLYSLALFVSVAAVVILWAVFSFKLFKVPQNGMYPAIGTGDYLIVRKRPYREASQVKRGDVIVYEQNREGQIYYFVWRVIGLPGETVTIREGILGVNGREIPQKKLGMRDHLNLSKETLGEVSYEVAFDPKVSDPPFQRTIQVPADHFFVMGDNRHNAFDSRFTGPVPFQSIVGKVAL